MGVVQLLHFQDLERRRHDTRRLSPFPKCLSRGFMGLQGWSMFARKKAGGQQKLPGCNGFGIELRAKLCRMGNAGKD
jgi:hypothetical protein